jgi:ferredoxin-nitrate reductase
MAQTRTLCPYCGVGCGLLVNTERGRVRSVAGDPDYPVNSGRTCRKPLELPSAVHAADRALTPLVRDRRDVRFREAGWDETMATIAQRIRSTVAEHGPEAIAFYISGQLLTEDYYTIVKLAKGFLGTNNVDSNSRLCMSSAVAGYTGAFGSDGPPPSYADIEQASCFFLLGTNTAACHPIVWSRISDRRAQGATVICADPRRTATAAGSDLHLPVKPGTDLALLNAMLHVVQRDGLVDDDYVAAHTTGWEEALAVAAEWTPARAAAVCGLEAATIERAAHLFASAEASMALWSMGANQSTVGTAKNRALINLCLATGQIGRPGAGPLSLTGQPNAMGGRETGGLAHLLPGYRRVDSGADREAMERHWSRPAGAISPTPGLAAVDLFHAVGEGRIKIVWVVATNPAVSMPEGGAVRDALAKAELLICQDAHHPTETSALAHIALPAAAWPEKTGTMTNSERRVALVQAAVSPPGEARPDWRIFAHLARELGHGADFAWEDEAEVFAEFAAATAGRVCDLSGLDHDRLREGSVQWPCPDGTATAERLYADHRYPTADGRARFAATDHTDPADATGDAFPLRLTTGRVADHWHTLSRTGKSQALLAASPTPFAEIHPDDAAAAGLRAGESAIVRSRRGETKLRVVISDSVPRGVVFAPFHWGSLHAPAGEGSVNRLLSGAADPVSGQPELKAAAVRLERVGIARRRTPRRLVVVGGGMAALATVEHVRARRPAEEWQITMLAEEFDPPYNRIKLSELLGGSRSNGDLDLHPKRWYAERAVDLRLGSPAHTIDLRRRMVHDGRGGHHTYDRLVLATGSRAYAPPIPGLGQAHVIRFRSQRDVARIAAKARRAKRALVIGGGLLGLEAAAGLRERGIAVTVVESAAWLMPQQLDAAGGAVVAAALDRLGIRSVVGCTVATVWPDRVRLQNGDSIPADLVVVAAGIRPEIQLARAGGIETRRGILVDDGMRTGSPDVFAVGECAEHRDTVYGLWAPLAEGCSGHARRRPGRFLRGRHGDDAEGRRDRGLRGRSRRRPRRAANGDLEQPARSRLPQARAPGRSPRRGRARRRDGAPHAARDAACLRRPLRSQPRGSGCAAAHPRRVCERRRLRLQLRHPRRDLRRGRRRPADAGADREGNPRLHRLRLVHRRRGSAAGAAVSGIVHLVGAGPGDPELITLRGLRLLRECEVVIYDRLVAPELVEEVPADALRIDRSSLDQEQVTLLLLRHARAGRRVVRLKGGDPFVFGRGSEEALALLAAGIDCEVVPGVSSLSAVPGTAGIPVTHRGISGQVTLVSAQARNGRLGFDPAQLACTPGTIVVFMGGGRVGRIVEALLEHGTAPDTPAAIIANGTRADQQTAVARLADLPRVAESLPTPALVVIGEVVSLRDALAPACSSDRNTSVTGRKPARGTMVA